MKANLKAVQRYPLCRYELMLNKTTTSQFTSWKLMPAFILLVVSDIDRSALRCKARCPTLPAKVEGPFPAVLTHSDIFGSPTSSGTDGCETISQKKYKRTTICVVQVCLTSHQVISSHICRQFGPLTCLMPAIRIDVSAPH